MCQTTMGILYNSHVPSLSHAYATHLPLLSYSLPYFCYALLHFAILLLVQRGRQKRRAGGGSSEVSRVRLGVELC